jgi:TonB family protein
MAQRRTERVAAPLFLIESQLVQRVAKEVKMSRFRAIASLLPALAILLLTGTAAVWSFALQAPQTLATSLSPNGQSLMLRPSRNSLPVASRKIYKIGKNIKPPHPIPGHDPQPSYTQQATKAKLSGTATFSVVVEANGNVGQVKEISKPLGLGLDESAMRTVRTWKFRPRCAKASPSRQA